MAITAAEAYTAANSVSAGLTDELDLIYALITSKANSGFFETNYTLTDQNLKAAVISQLGVDGYITQVINVGGEVIRIRWDTPTSPS